MLEARGFMAKYYAYCWADGKIGGYAKRIPNGALPIAQYHNKNILKEIVKLHASDNGRYLPGVRLAYLGITGDDPIDCLIRFGDYLNNILEREKLKRGKK